jgi:hypothetical protein
VSRLACRGCYGNEIERVVDLGLRPASDQFPSADDPRPDPRWPLELWFCRSCRLAQLGPVEKVPPERSLAVESQTSRAHAEESARALLRARPAVADAVVSEYGSHHHGGSWLRHLITSGCRVGSADEPADVVIDIHGIMHEPDTAQALHTRVKHLAPDGLLVLECHHLLPLITRNEFDMIRHGHWSYMSLTALTALAAEHDLTAVAARQVEIFGGSLQVTFERGSKDMPPEVREILAAEVAAGVTDLSGLRALHNRATHIATTLKAALSDYHREGRSVLGYGAPSKAPVLLGLSGIGPSLLPFTVDMAPGKHGTRIPGCGIPIHPIEDLIAAKPSVVLMLTWDIADEVIAQLEADGGWGATYLIPLPEPHEVPTGGSPP